MIVCYLFTIVKVDFKYITISDISKCRFSTKHPITTVEFMEWVSSPMKTYQQGLYGEVSHQSKADSTFHAKGLRIYRPKSTQKNRSIRNLKTLGNSNINIFSIECFTTRTLRF